MLHTATLVHDDIIDEPKRAAGGPPPTPHGAMPSAFWPATALHAVVCDRAGGAQLPRAGAADLADPADGEGELLQMQKLGHLINEEEYFDLIYRKTACLFSVSMQLGGPSPTPTRRPR